MLSSQEKLDEALRRLWKSLDEMAASIARIDETVRAGRESIKTLETFLETHK